MELFLKTIDEVRAAFRHRVKREHLGVICLISALVWLHPLFRPLLGLGATSGRRTSTCVPALVCARGVREGHGEGSPIDRVSLCVYAHKHRGRLVCRSRCGVGDSAPVQMCAHVHADVD